MANTTPLSSPAASLARPMTGALWKVLSCAAFAAINGIVRYLEGGGSVTPEISLSTNVLMFYQNLFGTLFMLPFVWQLGLRSLVTRYPGLHLLRVFAAVTGIGFWYLTLATMPIAEGVALSFTGPVFTVIGASLLLSERLSKERMLACFLSLLGAFVITRPDKALWQPGASYQWSAFFPLCSALVLAISKILTRKLASLGETPESLAIYLLLLMIPVSFVAALFEWQWPAMTHWPWLIALGGLSALAHLSFGRAYKHAEVTFLMPFGFSKFLFSMLIGYVFFVEVPSQALWLGIAIIGISLWLLTHKISLYSIAKRLRSN